MSSAMFQPLLHDPLGWKASNTTYTDTFKWRNYGPPSKDKKPSPYGQQYQRQMRKQQQYMKFQPANAYLLQSTNEEQPVPRIILVKEQEENREVPPGSYQFSRSKTLPVVVEEPPVHLAEYKKRPNSTYRDVTDGSRAPQRSAIAPAVTRASSLEARRYAKEDKEKFISNSDDDYYRHWLTYPNPPTPSHIVDAKQRLGQVKLPSTLARSVSGLSASGERQHQQISQSYEYPDSTVSNRQQKKSADRRHLLDCDLPETPLELRAARHRLEKHRYHPSLDDYPPRPQTYPEDTDDVSKSLTPPTAPESEDEQLPSDQTVPTKDDTSATDEENKTTDNEPSSVPVDGDGLPNEYYEALEVSDAAQEEYFKNLKTYGEKRPDNSVYRIPSTAPENKQRSFLAYLNQQQTTPPINNTNSTNRNEFGNWIRKSSDKERGSAMRSLNDVLRQPVMGYEIPKKHQVIFKQSPVLSSSTNSGVRQLGRTRNHQRIPCEICEKQLIKHHIWSLSRSSSLACPHQA